MVVPITHHVEGNDMLKGNVASFVTLDQTLVYQDRTASRWQAQDERSLGRRTESFDTLWRAGLVCGLWGRKDRKGSKYRRCSPQCIWTQSAGRL